MKVTTSKAMFILCFLILSAFKSISQFYVVNTERLNVRNEINSVKPLGYIKYGDTVEVIGRSNPYWYKIKIGSHVGYVRSKFLLLVRSAATTSKNQGMSDKDKLFAAGLFIFALGCTMGLLFIGKKERSSLSVKGPVSSTVLIKQKSVGVAIILSIFFGPIGMLYSTIKGALIMIILPIISLFIVVGMVYRDVNSETIGVFFYGNLIFYSLFYWLICIIWAAIAASKKNEVIIQPLN